MIYLSSFTFPENTVSNPNAYPYRLFRQRRGETLFFDKITVLYGDNGCGKSTLLKAAMGLLGSSGMVTRGDIWYKGRNLPDLPARALRKLNGPELGMIFQSAGSSFCPIRTVGAQFYEIMTQHGSVAKKEFESCALELKSEAKRS